MRNFAANTRLLALSLTVVAAVPALPAIARAAAPAAPAQVLVRFARGTSSAEQAKVLARAGLTRVRTIPRIGVVVARARDGATAAGAENRLDAQPHVVYAERDGLAHAAATPSDPSYAAVPWTYTVPNIPGALDVGLGSATVYVLDSGVDSTQPDLSGAVQSGYNTFSTSAAPDDDNGHGTRVAGVIAARANNGIGGAGVCPGCKVVPVKVLDSTGYGPWSNVAAGLVWASDQGARIVNLSLSSVSSSQTLEDAITYAVGKGVLVIAAGGNDSSSSPTYPASLPGVLGVAGSDWNDRVYNGSNYGSWLKLAAPGCYETTQSGGGYTNACGTSIAAPIVAGVAALMLSNNGNLTPTQIEDALAATARPVAQWTDGSANYACPTGGCVAYGRLDAAAAVASVTPLPAAAAPPVLNGSAKVGQTLTATTGTWDNAPTGYSYDFRRCDADGTSNCSSVQTGSQSSYVVASADFGKTILVRVTATNAAGSGTSASAARTIGADAPSLAAVDLGGSTLVNQALTTATVASSVGGSPPITVAYSWWRCDASGASCGAIGGQSGTSYTLGLGDLGSTIRVRVTATNVTGSVDFDSAVSPVITAVAVAPSFGSATPTVTGTAAVGSTLTASQPAATGTWPLTYAGAWTRCDASGANCAATGVTSATYTLAAADAGKTLRYTLTATNGGGSATASALSAVVAGGSGGEASAPSFGSLKPVLTGTASVGKTLSASQPTATGAGPITYTGAWARCDATGVTCVDSGVTTATYTVATADVGKSLRYTLTATSAAGTATTSVLSAPVAAAGASTTASDKPDLSLLIAAPATAAAGTSVKLHFTVRGRAGTADASAVELSVTLPAELTLDMAQTGDGSACTATGKTVACEFDSITPGVDGVADVSANVAGSAAGFVTVKATVSSAEPDANLNDNTAQAGLNVTTTTKPPLPPPATAPPTTPPTTPTTPPPTSSKPTSGGTTKKPKPAATPKTPPSAPGAAVAAVPASRKAWAQLPLRAKLGGKKPPTGNVRYQWQVQLGDSWVPIEGATASTYTPDPSYAGSRLRVVASGAGGTTATSAPTAPLGAALSVGGGKAAKVGARLRASLAAGVVAKGARAKYQWQVLDHGTWLPVSGATKARFTPNAGAAGLNVRVVVRAGGRTFASKPTPPVAKR